MFALMIHAMQGANWQRSGGQGDKPTLIERPREGAEIKRDESQSFELADIRTELDRRRNARSKNT
ncbi:hypothetical protein AB0G00_24120 [Nocardia salmonicida]|uniref:hypothetical protein n=1 Tax=Nocardia salmonicida TaxID=53431 RepID=UPI003401BADF